jgi:hypothetical protein
MKRLFAALTIAATGAISAQAALAVPSGAQPFARLDEAETAALARGETVFREASGWKDLAVPPDAPFASSLIEETRKSGANYIGEVLMVLPRTGATEALPARLAAALSDVEGYVGISYYSKKNRQTYKLFDRMKVIERSGSAAAGRVRAEQHMEPFSAYEAGYEWSSTPASVSFRSENLTPLSYKGTKAVSPGTMVWRLEAYAAGDSWVLYGIGRVKAFDMLGILRDRLSASFMGRIQAFFGSMYEKGM